MVGVSFRLSGRFVKYMSKIEKKTYRSKKNVIILRSDFNNNKLPIFWSSSSPLLSQHHLRIWLAERITGLAEIGVVINKPGALLAGLLVELSARIRPLKQ